MTNLTALVRSQHEHEQMGGTFIGSLVWWSLNGNRIPHQELKDLAQKYNLPEHYLPTEVRPASAFRRAWRHASTRLPNGLLLRQIDDTDTGIHIGLVREQTDTQNQELQYEHMVTVAFSKDHHTIQSSAEHSAVDEVRSLYQHHLELTTRDIRTMLSNFVSEAGVSLRESGGVYFVAAPHQETIEAMSLVLQSIGHNQLHQLPLYNSTLAQSVLNEVTVSSLDDEIRKLGEELETFLADDKTRRSTLEKRLDVFDALRCRVSTFAGVLSFKASDLLDRVSEMEGGLRLHLGLTSDSYTDKSLLNYPTPPTTEENQPIPPTTIHAPNLESTPNPVSQTTPTSPFALDTEAGF